MIRRVAIALLPLLLVGCVEEVDLRLPQDAGPDSAVATDAVPLPDAAPTDAGP